MAIYDFEREEKIRQKREEIRQKRDERIKEIRREKESKGRGFERLKREGEDLVRKWSMSERHYLIDKELKKIIENIEPSLILELNKVEKGSKIIFSDLYNHVYIFEVDSEESSLPRIGKIKGGYFEKHANRFKRAKKDGVEVEIEGSIGKDGKIIKDCIIKDRGVVIKIPATEFTEEALKKLNEEGQYSEVYTYFTNNVKDFEVVPPYEEIRPENF